MNISEKQFRLTHVVEYGLGDPQSGAISLIYNSFLKKYNIDFYNRIQINQIGEGLDELVIIESKEVHVNIKWPAKKEYKLLSPQERNMIRLDIIHNAMLRVAEEDKRIEVSILEKIKQEVENRSFLFEFVVRDFTNIMFDISAKLIVAPAERYFDFHIQIERVGEKDLKFWIYKGLPNIDYAYATFCHGAWESANIFSLSDESNRKIISIDINNRSVCYHHFTPIEYYLWRLLDK